MSRAEAARTNGAKSKGPKTEAGKAISSQNALHFGLNATEVVIPGEDPAEYEELLQSIHDTYYPATAAELDLVSELAAARWRLRRLPKMEKAAQYAAARRVQNEPDAAGLTPEERELRIWNELTNGPELRQIHRHETRLRRIWEKGRAELESLIAERLLGELEAQKEADHAALMAQVEADTEAARIAHASRKRPALVPAPTSASPRVQNEPATGSDQPNTRAA